MSLLKDLLDQQQRAGGVRVEPLPAVRPAGWFWWLPPNFGTKVASVLTWCGAVYTTYLMVASLQPGTPLWLMVGVAAVAQFIFTRAERPMIVGRAKPFTWAVFCFDAIVNAGGIFPLLVNIGKSPPAQMLAAIGVPPEVGGVTTVLLALALGGIIAVAPEALWRMKD